MRRPCAATIDCRSSVTRLQARKRWKAGLLYIVIPPSTLQIETPIAVTEEAPEPAAEDFLKFLWSDEGQELWAENGYRPVNPKLVDPKQFPAPEKGLFKIAKFGGWSKVKDEFFDEEEGSAAKIETELGVSTSG